MYSECKNEHQLRLDNTKQNPVSISETTKETTMSTKQTSSSLALVKDILNIIALKPEMFF
jgi:hypothetical protein